MAMTAGRSGSTVESRKDSIASRAREVVSTAVGRASRSAVSRRSACPGNSGAKGEVADAENVGTAEAEEQEHLGRPPPDAGQGDEQLDDRLVAHLQKPPPPQGPGVEGGTQLLQVEGLSF